jgi:pimeloyl-ACP methyl ester carboxylesterase
VHVRGLIVILLLVVAPPAVFAANVGPRPTVQLSRWHGFDRLDFTVQDRPAILIVPATPAAGRPWIWRTEFFEHEPQVDLALLARGWFVAYVDAKNMYGNAKAMGIFGQFYAHLVVNYGLAKRAVLEGFSRGGLYAVNFAINHPTRVAALSRRARSGHT